MALQTTQEIVGLGLSADKLLLQVRDEVVDCRLCPRLVEYREDVARNRKKEFADWDYWAKPVPGFGDPNASLLIVGLAPAAHGGNRTGRVFTGDRSGDFLVKALYKAGFANQPLSRSRDDGLRLKGVYVTAAVKCAPPDNKPTREETMNCAQYLAREVDALSRMKAVLCLGQFAFQTVLNTLRSKYDLGQLPSKFQHGLVLDMGEPLPLIFSSYHPSPRNTQTGKLTERMFLSLLIKVRRKIETSRASQFWGASHAEFYRSRRKPSPK